MLARERPGARWADRLGACFTQASFSFLCVYLLCLLREVIVSCVICLCCLFSVAVVLVLCCVLLGLLLVDHGLQPLHTLFDLGESLYTRVCMCTHAYIYIYIYIYILLFSLVLSSTWARVGSSPGGPALAAPISAIVIIIIINHKHELSSGIIIA